MTTSHFEDHFDAGERVREVAVSPHYPMQTMLAVFDFPEKAVPGAPYVVPELVVDRITGPGG